MMFSRKLRNPIIRKRERPNLTAEFDIQKGHGYDQRLPFFQKLTEETLYLNITCCLNNNENKNIIYLGLTFFFTVPYFCFCQ